MLVFCLKKEGVCLVRMQTLCRRRVPFLHFNWFNGGLDVLENERDDGAKRNVVALRLPLETQLMAFLLND